MAFETVYEVGRDGWSESVFMIITGMLLTAFLGVGALRPQMFAPRKAVGREEQGCLRAFAIFGAAFSATILMVSTISASSRYSEFSAISRGGTCEIVQGPVRDYRMTHRREQFRVADVRFDYGRYDITGGFNDHGRYISEGANVRICYVERLGRRVILQLAVAQ